MAPVQLFGKRLERWWEVPLQALQETLRDVCAESRMADIAEPELYSFLARFRGDSAAELEERAAASFLLLLLAVTRLSVLLESHSDGWVGGIEHYRLPPQVLARDLLEATKAGSSTLGYLARVLDRFVVRQHETNALRKLAAQPELDTALFILERDVFIPIANHTAGTSNPRFLNVVTFLADLGYLRIGDGTQLTADGQELLNRLRQLTASS